MKRRQRSGSAWRRASFQVLARRHLCREKTVVSWWGWGNGPWWGTALGLHLIASLCLFVWGGRTWTLTLIWDGQRQRRHVSLLFLGSHTHLWPAKRRKEVIHKVCGPSRGSRQTEASVYKLSLSTLVPILLSIIFYGQHLRGRYPKQRLLRQHFRLLNWAYKASPPLHFSLFINWGGASNLPLRTAWGQLWRRQQTWKSPI